MRPDEERDRSFLILMILAVFSAAFIIGAFFAGDIRDLPGGLLRISISPSQLTRDSFKLGTMGAAFLNTGLIGALVCLLLAGSGAQCSGLSIAAFWLNAGFGTYGMTIPSMIPFIIGTFIYAKVRRLPLRDVIHAGLFGTALAPFAQELMVRYPGTAVHAPSPAGIAAALALGIVTSFAIGPLCAHSPNFHKGYNLYNAGPAAGFLAFFFYTLLYRSPGIEVPSNTDLGEGNRLFVTVFFLIVFGLCLLAAYLADRDCFRKYRKIWKSDGYKTDFTKDAGMSAALVNMGVYGLFILLYYSLAAGITVTEGGWALEGAKFNGATMGAIMCMYAFCAMGQTPRTVFPIILGYILCSLVPLIAFVSGAAPAQNWNLTTQAILVGLCYSSGLAPVTGRFGAAAGIAAGFIHALLVMTVPLLHGGFCLYNGGFTAGITAFILVPVLEHYLGGRLKVAAAKQNE